MFIPSFSSFPSFDSSEIEPGPSQSHKSEAGKAKKKEKKKSHRKDHSRKHGRDTSESAADAPFNEEAEATKLYYSDRKADHLNIEYGRLYQGDIPKYSVVNRAFHPYVYLYPLILLPDGRKILGLPYAYTAFSRSNKGVEVGLHRRLVC